MTFSKLPLQVNKFSMPIKGMLLLYIIAFGNHFYGSISRQINFPMGIAAVVPVKYHH